MSYPIKYGDNNEAVKIVQTFLNKFNAANLTVDGKWGSKTNSAAIKALLPPSIDQAALESMQMRIARGY